MPSSLAAVLRSTASPWPLRQGFGPYGPGAVWSLSWWASRSEETGDHYTGSLERIAAGDLARRSGLRAGPPLTQRQGPGAPGLSGAEGGADGAGRAFFPFSMAKTGRMVLSRACASCGGFRWWVAAFWPLLCAWIRTGPTGWCRPAGLQVPASFSLEPGFCQEEAPGAGRDWATPSL